jgi:serpin B
LKILSFLLIFITSVPGFTQGFRYAIVDGNNGFAFDVYALKAANEKSNVFLSPFSASAALAMTYEGARGNTATQMMHALRFVENKKTLHQEFSALMKSLQTRDSVLLISNALWGQDNYAFEEEFLSTTKKYYGSGLLPLDFINQSNESRLVINNAVEQQTKNKIKDLLPEGSIGGVTRLVLTNAIYFKASWAKKFDEKLTKSEDFFLTKDKPVKAPFMEQKGYCDFFSNEIVSMISLPYLNGKFSMLILLPENSIEDLEKYLVVENYSDWTGKLQNFEIEKIQIPKFRIEQETDLVPILKGLGMTDAFKEVGADFTGIAQTGPLHISGIFHKTFVEVNEEGTEAAAATAVAVVTRSMPSKKDAFIANRPFVFIIRDNATNSILFIGRVMEPGDFRN